MSDKIKIAFELPRQVVFGAACALAGGLLFSATLSFATLDGDTSTSDVLGSQLIVPYDGFLMLDSQPVDGEVKIQFDLYDVATGGTSVWTETQVLTAYSGRFSAGLGASTDITNSILDAEQLYLGMSIIEVDASGADVATIELGGRQAIEAAPYAAWAANSADFNVGGALQVAGDAEITGNLKVGDSGAVAMYENGANQLYISPSKGHTGGVYVGNDLYTNYNTKLGPNDGSGSTRIIGADSDGSSSYALKVEKSDGSAMYLDDNEIDSNNALFLQNNSGNQVTAGGDFEVVGEVVGGLHVNAEGNGTIPLQVGQFTIDSEDGAGLINLVAGAYYNASGDYEYLDTRGASRILMGDGAMSLVVGDAGSSGGQAAGDVVNFQTALSINNDADVTVENDLTVTGKITGLALASEAGQEQNSDASDVSLGVSVEDGFCFLTRINFDNSDGNPARRECSVSIDSNGDWTITNEENNSQNSSDMNCTAHCVLY